MQYGNILTQQQTDTLPTKLGDTFNPTLAMLQAAGWRKITEIEQPATGYRAAGYTVVALTAVNAKLAITSQINIADEEAAAKLARRQWAKAQIDSDIVSYVYGWAICQLYVKTGLAADMTAAKKLLTDKIDSMPLT